MAPSVGPQFLIIGEFAGAGTKICRGSWASEALLVSHQVRFKTAIDSSVFMPRVGQLCACVRVCV